MIAFEATITVNGGEAETLLVGAVTLAQAARKAQEAISENPKKELVSVVKTSKVIL